jgi:hypothetical protein
MNPRTHGTEQDTNFQSRPVARELSANQYFGVFSAPAAKLAIGTGTIVSSGTDLP